MRLLQLDPVGLLDIDQFRLKFNLSLHEDIGVKKKHSDNLLRYQRQVREANKKYLRGNQTWSAATYAFADLGEAQFTKLYTGRQDGIEETEESRLFFSQNKDYADNIPPAYDSTVLGYVSPVKAQGPCGSCVVFTTLAVIETCFKKVSGEFVDLSEQHMMDCGYDGIANNGCKGASMDGYLRWMSKTNPTLALEKDYPYTAKLGTCRTDYPQHDLGSDQLSCVCKC